jgi:predicted enzyme related to lactoylglutathione lyase
MVKQIAFTMYPAIDISRARQFYEERLGLKATSEYANGQWVEYENDNGCFVLTTMSPVKPSSNMGGNIAFEVEDIVALTEQLKNAGITVQMDITETPSFRMSVIIDSEGNSVTLCQQN